MRRRPTSVRPASPSVCLVAAEGLTSTKVVLGTPGRRRPGLNVPLQGHVSLGPVDVYWDYCNLVVQGTIKSFLSNRFED